VRRVWVVLPPQDFVTGAGKTAIKAEIADQARKRLGRPIGPGEAAAIEKHLQFVVARDLTTASALGALKSVGQNDCAIILHAAAYRSEDLPESRAYEMGSVLAEDQWARHLLVLAAGAVDYARASQCYVMLATGFPVPHRAKNSELLKTIAGCGVFNM